MENSFKTELKKIFKERVFFDQPLALYTTYKIGGHADFMVFPRSISEIKYLLNICSEKGVPYCIWGGGSNILVLSERIRAVIINLSKLNNISLSRSINQKTSIYAQAGVTLSRLLEYTVDKSFSGFEFLAGIPGTLGGALFMNAGSQGMEIKDIILSLTLMEINTSTREIDRDNLRFSYRNLDIKDGSIILNAKLLVNEGDKEKIKAGIKDNLLKRRRSQPINLPGAGCIFKNPAGGSAGKIIEKVGVKGMQKGDAKISKKHGNFIENMGSAKADDVLYLIKTIKDTVFSRTGIILEPEIKFLGESGFVLPY
ncbi:MAG: UDP-N-acetylmuramate dehydrogenase [Thermodesulfobacteriota bacterium]|nr:UDP-N-acetylmuramate dehydrogenase [Thermodesulfobacteriota bacterium]